MATSIKNWWKSGIPALNRLLHATGNSPAKTLFEIVSDCGKDVMSKREVYHWSSSRPQSTLMYNKIEHKASKEGGLIRELSSNSKPTFYPCTVFSQQKSDHSSYIFDRFSLVEAIFLLPFLRRPILL